MSDAHAVRDGFVTVNGLRLAWREWPGPGEKRPPALLLHGLASSRRIWDLVGPLLASERRVVALDQRGHGESDKPDTGYTLAQVVADDRAAAAALGLEHPIVVGHSWGGAVALTWAATYPDDITELTLVDGGVSDMQSRPGSSWERTERELMPPDYAGTTRESFLDRLRARTDLPWRQEFEEILLNLVDLLPDGTVRPRLSREHHRRLLRSLWDFHPADFFPLVTCPTTLVLADSSAADERTRAAMAAKQRGADAAWRGLTRALGRRILWFTETAHDIPLHRPEDLAGVVSDE